MVVEFLLFNPETNQHLITYDGCVYYHIITVNINISENTEIIVGPAGSAGSQVLNLILMQKTYRSMFCYSAFKRIKKHFMCSQAWFYFNMLFYKRWGISVNYMASGSVSSIHPPGWVDKDFQVAEEEEKASHHSL